MSPTESQNDDHLADFLKQQMPDSEAAANVLADAEKERAANPRKPFSKAPKGATAGALVVLVLFVGIWIALKLASWLLRN